MKRVIAASRVPIKKFYDNSDIDAMLEDARQDPVLRQKILDALSSKSTRDVNTIKYAIDYSSSVLNACDSVVIDYFVCAYEYAVHGKVNLFFGIGF